MKLGLITDVHERDDLLRTALDRFMLQQVDRIVFIGDVFLTGERMRPTCHLLAEAGVIGVWGNHDYGFCQERRDSFRERYGDVVVDFMSTLEPRLVVDGCFFQHVEPWLDATNLLDLWYFEGIPNSPRKIARIFSAVQHRIIFAGHFHRWLAVSGHGLLPWKGQVPLQLSRPDRYFVVIGALCEGRFATFDTETCELMPHHL